MNEFIIDCHYCEYAVCDDDKSLVDCYSDDNGYFDHSVKNSRKEAEECNMFEFCSVFPKT